MAKILIIDDDPVFSELLADIIASIGHQSFLASGGAEALGMLQADCRPDLILVDLQMQHMDGYGTIDALRLVHAELKPAVVMLTAAKSDEAAAAARDHGAIGFLTKPVQPALLQQQLARFLSDARIVWLDDHHTVTRAA